MRAVLIGSLLLLSLQVVLAQQGAPTIPLAKISLPDPAYIGMPIWMQIESGTRVIGYPSTTTPNDFNCNEVEVKKDGVLLKPARGSPPGGRGGAPCGWLGVADIAKSKLPIHLQYRLTEPGTYEVRFTRRQYIAARGMVIAEQSQWMPLHLRTASPDAIEHWLETELAAVPASSPGQLLGDVLPSLLAICDIRVLRLMIDLSYRHCAADDTINWCPDRSVASYAAESLLFFDPGQVQTEVLVAFRRHGPSDAIAYVRRVFDAISPEIVAASLLSLHSPRPEVVEAAVHTLIVIPQPPVHVPDQLVRQIQTSLQNEVDFVVDQKNERAAWWLANFLGSTRPPNARTLLWKLAEARLGGAQTLACITWFRDDSDLPRLTVIAAQYDPTDPHGYNHFGVAQDMYRHYGTAAQPFLRDLLSSSKQTWVRTESAKGLLQMNDEAGWDFFIDTLKQQPFYRAEMIQWLQRIFPAIQGADDKTVLTFLQAKRQSSSKR